MIVLLHILWLSTKELCTRLFYRQYLDDSTQTSEDTFNQVNRIVRAHTELCGVKTKPRQHTKIIMYRDYDSDSDSDGFELTSGPPTQSYDVSYARNTSQSNLSHDTAGAITQGGRGFGPQGGTGSLQGPSFTSSGAARSTNVHPVGRGAGRALAKKKGALGMSSSLSNGQVYPVGRGTIMNTPQVPAMQAGCSTWETNKEASTDWFHNETKQSAVGGTWWGNEQETSQNVQHQSASVKDNVYSRKGCSKAAPDAGSCGKVGGEEDWGGESNLSEYVVKAKEFKPSAEFDFKSITDANPGVSPKWLASKLANKPVQPNEQESKALLHKLEDLWQGQKDKSYISRFLAGQFERSVNPFVLCCFLIDRASDSRIPKTTTLAFFVMREFDKWYKTNKGLVSPEKFISSDLQLRVFNVCTRTHMTLFDIATRCFHLCYEGNDQFLSKVQAFVLDRKYKEAAVCVGRLGLQNHFTVEQIVLPLLLQDKINLLETYVCGSPQHQRLLVQYLDFLCDVETNLDLIIGSVKNVSGIKRDKFQKKSLSKLAIRLQKLYKIPQDMCPNITNARGVGAIRYLLRKKYIEHGFGGGSWGDMVEQAVGDSMYLRKQLVEQLVAFNDPKEAAYWANFYNLPSEELPPAVQEAKKDVNSVASSNTTSSNYADEEEDWDSACYTEEEVNAAYHQLALPVEKIMMVDTMDKYKTCMADITRPGSLVGIDSEWRPGFGGKVISKVALIQLATKENIYLLDVLALDRVFSDVTWSQFAENFFCNESVLKLGYGIETDLKMMMVTFPSMKEVMPSVRRFVNLETLAKQLVMADTVVVPFYEDDDTDAVPKPPSEMTDNCDSEPVVKIGFSEKEEKGLSELVRRCLGRPLNKSQQMSNWELRPLRKEQIVYAALDAYALVEVYDILVRKAGSSHQDIDLEPPISMKWLKPSKNEKRRARTRGDHKEKLQSVPSRPTPVFQHSRAPKELRIIVDTMLQGLGRQLRSCGVDVLIPDADMSHETCAQIGLRENRIVLTSGIPYHMMCNLLGANQCYRVESEGARTQVLEVLKYFNIQVQQEDLFSRCQVCNGDVYITIKADDIHQLCLHKEELQKAAAKDQSGLFVGKTNAATSGLLRTKFASLGIDWDTVTILGTSVSVQTETVHQSMFGKVDTFFVCMKCGKVFWEGSHFERITEQFSHVLNQQQGASGSVYDRLKTQ